jgi:diadenosine tetraphosphate (Ap4A) HIT family hydrolase
MEKLFPNDKVIVTEHFDVHQDWQTPIPGLFIVESKRKIASIEEFTDEESREFIRLIRYLRKGMRELLNIEKIIMFQNEDSEWGFHVWMFPLYEWMKRFGHGTRSIKLITEHARKNMANSETINEVKEKVSIVREFMEKF